MAVSYTHLDVYKRQALGVGGYPRGRIIEIYGPESSGKTTLAIHAIAEAQKAGGIAEMCIRDRPDALQDHQSYVHHHLQMPLLKELYAYLHCLQLLQAVSYTHLNQSPDRFRFNHQTV